MREVFEGAMSLKEHKTNYWDNLGVGGIERQSEGEYQGSVLWSVLAIKKFVNGANIISKCHTMETLVSFRLIGKCLKIVRKIKFH